MAIETTHTERKVALSEMETRIIKARNASLRAEQLKTTLAGVVPIPPNLQALIPGNDDGTVADACRLVTRRTLEVQFDKEVNDARAAVVGLADMDTYKRMLTDIGAEAAKSPVHANLKAAADVLLEDLTAIDTKVNALTK